MLTFREWEVYWRDGRPVLRSPIMGTIWERPRLYADASPVEDRQSGVYSITHWAKSWLDVAPLEPICFNAVGAVDAFGAIVIHDDGVVRSEAVRILALRLVPYSGRSCRHDDVYIDVTYPAFGAEKLMHCPCGTSYASYRRKWLSDFRSLEELLLETYRVPRLPDGMGPWHRPIGARPAPKL